MVGCGTGGTSFAACVVLRLTYGSIKRAGSFTRRLFSDIEGRRHSLPRYVIRYLDGNNQGAVKSTVPCLGGVPEITGCLAVHVTKSPAALSE